MQLQERIRNFSIIAHIDHGKTTLTDCFLRVTKTISDLDTEERIMDSNPIEKERGITIKLAPVRMEFPVVEEDGTSQTYILNLIDTPGHVDFGYEVSRSLAACEGALLVVDATQGIQAQTLSTYYKAKDLGLVIIPVINKIDLPSSDVDRVTLEIMELCNIDEDDIIKVSAKTRLNVTAVLEAIVKKIPPPTASPTATVPRALLITSHFDSHKGAIALVRMIDGTLKKEKMQFVMSGVAFLPVELGFFRPNMIPVAELQAGEVGYIATGLKDVRDLKIGDTITRAATVEGCEPLEGYNEPQPLVYMELYPIDSAEFTILQDAMDKLVLRDAALQFSGTHSPALGSGMRVGFLGILHAEIVIERLQREFNLDLIATSPTVTYQMTLTEGEEIIIKTPAEFPDPSIIKEIREPMTELRIVTSQEHMSLVLELVKDRRGSFKETQYINDRVILICSMPLAEMITDFQDKLKSATSGYASFEYQLTDFQIVDAVKVGVMLNHELIEALSFITVMSQAEREGKKIVAKLKDVLPRQMFELPIQAAVGGRVVARETVKAYRKDVTAHLYGGDRTRRMKLLNKQAKGKKRMKAFGKVELDQDTFLKILKR